MTTVQSKEICAIILQQLGGRRFIAMTGSKNFVADGNTLRMNLTRNRVQAKWLSITLNEMDTYDMVFQGIKGGELVTKVEKLGIYDDQLQSIFTDVTGLYTSL